MTAGALRYFGRPRSGAGVTGYVTAGTVAAFVERCYRNRWTALRVLRDGEIVGAIEPTQPGATTRARFSYWAEVDA